MPAGQLYIDAAHELSSLADEFEDCTEVCQTLRRASADIAKMGVKEGAILKIATAKVSVLSEDDEDK